MDLLPVIKFQSADEPDALFKKEFNINSFANLEREGLKYYSRERRILLESFANNGEKLYLQYPGKESVRNPPMPWDMRPKLDSEIDNGYYDLAFNEVFRDLKRFSYRSKDKLQTLAYIFCRMAFMMDHKLVSGEYTTYLYGRDYGVLDLDNPVSLHYYAFRPDRIICDWLEDEIGEIRNMSALCYLQLNDIIAQNEDCKYYYQSIQTGHKWSPSVGRYNMLMTYVNIVGNLLYVDGCIVANTKETVSPVNISSISEITGARVIPKT